MGRSGSIVVTVALGEHLDVGAMFSWHAKDSLAGVLKPARTFVPGIDRISPEALPVGMAILAQALVVGACVAPERDQQTDQGRADSEDSDELGIMGGSQARKSAQIRRVRPAVDTVARAAALDRPITRLAQAGCQPAPADLIGSVRRRGGG